MKNQNDKFKIENLEDLFNVVQDAEQMFSRIFRTGFVPSIKIKESKENFIITLAAPGQKKESFDVTIDKGILTLKAEISEGNEFMESFSKSYRLPYNADTDTIKADYQAGILSIVISKKVEQPSKKVKIS